MNLDRMIFLCLWCSLFLLAGCQGDRQVIKQPLPQNSLVLICEDRNIPWYWDSFSHVLTFSTQEAPARVMIGSPLVLIGDRKVLLNHPIERKLNTIIVPPDFVRKVFGPVESKNAQIKQPFFVMGKFNSIMIDAGHGGHDPGAMGVKGLVEKDVVLDIALKLKANLEQMGFKVFMTRDNDEFVSLEKRTQMAVDKKVDLFLSIHANSVKTKNKKVRGMEMYYARPLDSDTDITQLKSNEQLYLKSIEISGDRAIPEKILSEMLYINKNNESFQLADKILKKTTKDLNAPNRGRRSSGFFVVKNSLVPSLLFEVGYLTSEGDAKLLKTPEYRKKIADAIANSIKEYHDES